MKDALEQLLAATTAPDTFATVFGSLEDHALRELDEVLTSHNCGRLLYRAAARGQLHEEQRLEAVETITRVIERRMRAKADKAFL